MKTILILLLLTSFTSAAYVDVPVRNTQTPLCENGRCDTIKAIVRLPKTIVQNTFQNCPDGKCPVVRTQSSSVQTQQSCPTGTCPISSSVQRTQTRQTHWSFPGNITNHLQTDHGQTISGMSTEDQLRLHDSIHTSSRSSYSSSYSSSSYSFRGNKPIRSFFKRIFCR